MEENIPQSPPESPKKPLVEGEPPKKKRKFLKILIGALITFAVLTTGVSGYWLYQEKIVKKPTPAPSPPLQNTKIPIFINNSPLVIIDGIYSYIEEGSNIKVKPSFQPHQWWISEDGWNILDRNAISLTYMVRIEREGSLEYQPNSTHPIAKTLNVKISDVFQANSFELDVANTSESETDDKFYDYVLAFKKDETRCTATTNNDVNHEGFLPEQNLPVFYYTIACSDRFEESYYEQVSYLKALNIRDAVVTVSKKIGDFVDLHVNHRRSGYTLMGKFSDGKWTEIYSGQDYPPCNLMEEYQVPGKIYNNICWGEEEIIEKE